MTNKTKLELKLIRDSKDTAILNAIKNLLKDGQFKAINSLLYYTTSKYAFSKQILALTRGFEDELPNRTNLLPYQDAH